VDFPKDGEFFGRSSAFNNLHPGRSFMVGFTNALLCVSRKSSALTIFSLKKTMALLLRLKSNVRSGNQCLRSLVEILDEQHGVSWVKRGSLSVLGVRNAQQLRDAFRQFVAQHQWREVFMQNNPEVFPKN